MQVCKKNGIRHRYLLFLLVMVLILTSSTSALFAAPPETSSKQPHALKANELTISPIWEPTIQQWAPHISALSASYGLHPDFIAAVIKEESNGRQDGISRVGAVGLMGVMPAGPGLEWRPSAEELMTPSVNLRWGVSILSEVIRQSGGDLASALAAYSGGWDQVSSRVPQEYAANVLNNYGRAIVSRSGISPDIANQWTIAIDMRRGHVTNDELLVLGDQPVSGLWTYGEHIVFDYVDQSGQAYYVRGYAVPVALVVPTADDAPETAVNNSNQVELELQARLGTTDLKIANHNPRVILACLPSLGRLRGHNSTRWFAPSNCPSWHR
ncbi:MAG: lytic transglycosylase domain-containing protein [Anaerolineales bacterium]|nr:lytic transglycosylase domain-containing protein [Anaerolineales bacterium]MCA9929507.1 lytic transglycosylase domain-containing protein [Anaerolineales bacterium]